MKYKYLFTNGDSWTWGQGLQEDQPDFQPHGHWPEVLGERLNLEVINIAENGSSNERICRSTVEWVVDNKDKLEDTLFMIGWTVSDRWEWWDNFEQEWTKCYAHHGGDTLTYKMPKKWWTQFYTRFFDINNMLYNSTLNMVLLQSFLKLKRCNYVFFQGFGTHHFSKYSSSSRYNECNVGVDMITPSIDHSNLFNQLDYDNIVVTGDYQSMDQFMRCKFGHENYPIEPVHGHPNREAHKLWAEELYKFIKENNLI